MERDRHSRQTAPSNRHSSRTDPAPSSSSAFKSQNASSASASLPKRGTTKRARLPGRDDQDSESRTSESSTSDNKGKGKQPAQPRRSSRNVSQPSHSPVLISKAAKEAAASSSATRTGKRTAAEIELPQDHSSKRSKPNSSSSRRTSSSGASPSSVRMSQKRSSGHSTASSVSSTAHSQGKSKGKSKSNRSGRDLNHNASIVTASSSGMNDHCEDHLADVRESGAQIKSAVSEAETGVSSEKVESKTDASSRELGSGSRSSHKGKANGAAKDEADAGDAEGAHDEDDDDEDDDDDGDRHFDDDAEDDYDDGPEGPGDDGAFGMNIRAMAGYMTGLTGRFRTLLSSLRSRNNPQAQLAALQELSDLLIVSTEDSLAGYFPIDSFVRELVYIMGGPKPPEPGTSASHRTGASGGGNGASASGSGASLGDGDSFGNGELDVAVKKEAGDDDAAMAAAIAAAAGFEDSGEIMLIACRCLANLMEAMPYAAHSVVTCGAIPVLCSKLIEITFIDLAEQVLQTLEKISVDYPAAIVKEGGLNAMLQFLDFFNIHVQRTAMTTAANCCRKLTADSFSMVFDIIPIVQNVLQYADQRLVESACKCVIRMIDSYRHQPELLEQLITPPLVEPLCNLLLAASGGSGASSASVIIGSNTHTELLKALGTASKSSAEVAVTLLDKNIVETLYQLLTGSLPPRDGDSADEKMDAPAELATVPAVTIEDVSNDTAISAAVAVVPNGANVTVADMAVLQNLAQRPKEQIQDALSLIAELLPPLPRDGTFDARAYSEKAHRRLLQKQKEKEREARRAARAARKATAGASAGSSSNSGKEKAEKADVDGDIEMNDSSVHDLQSMEGSTSTAQGSISAPVDEELTGGAAGTSSGAAILGSSLQRTERVKSERELAKEAANTRRIDKLKEHEGPVQRFSKLMLPTLVEVYAASVALHVRTKALTAILKITSFMEPDVLRLILKEVPVANFVADILSSREHASLVLSALQMVELLFVKLPDVYQTILQREGVMFEVEDIAAREPTGKGKAPEKSSDKTPTVKTEPVPVALPARTPTGAPATSASERRSMLAGSSLSAAARESLSVLEQSMAGRTSYNSMINLAATEADDANIWRARILRDKFAVESGSGDGSKRATEALDGIKQLVANLGEKDSEDVAKVQATVSEIANLFGKRDEPISSFELLKSGLIESLYQFSVSDKYKVSLTKRRQMLMNAFMADSLESGLSSASILVRRLQESLSRLENVEITTAISSNGDDQRRSPTSILAKQLRLRLVAEDSTDIPRSCHQVVVTIHAIASFQSLNDYLRPKIAASAGASSSADAARGASSSDHNSRLSSILAALSAAGAGSDGGMGAAAALRQSLAALSQGSAGGAITAPSSSTALAASGTTESKTAVVTPTSGLEEAETSLRRRSSRFGQSSAAEQGGVGESSTSAVGSSNESKASAAKKEDGESSATAAAAGALAEVGADADEALARRLVEGLLNEGYEDEMFTDEEYEEEVLEDDLPQDTSTENVDKAVSLEVSSSGDVEPETAAATEPAAEASSSAATGPSTSVAGSSSANRSTYAAALQRKPSDWHLEFFMDGKPINLKSTIYGAVHKFETTRSNAAAMSNRYIWQNIYTVTYKKVSGPSPTEEAQGTPEPEETSAAAIVLPDSVPKDAPYGNILQLLGVMHDLNTTWREESTGQTALLSVDSKAAALPESAFINNKLTAKLNRQLEEPMIVASSCLPGWCVDLPRVFPFLFPFEARYSYLQSTAFGYARLLTKWQNQHSRTQDTSSRRDDSFGFLSRLQRQKVRISRSRLFESAMKVFELYGHNTSVLEVEYFEEVGTGLGPTLEFYALASREFARRDLGIWRDDGNGPSGPKFIASPGGLFPAPTSTLESQSEAGKQRLAVFKTLGQFVAKALLDSRIIDCNFSPVFMKAVLNSQIPSTLASLRAVDAGLARSSEQLLQMNAETLEAMALDFTLPGHPSIELVKDGKSKSVTTENVKEYVDAIIKQTLHDGIQPAVRAFRRGFNLIMPLGALSSFTADELVMLFGNMEEDWSEATLLASIKPDHGFNSESASFRDLVAIMADFDVSKRRDFLQWLTGSPKLPIGGFAGLHPQLTIVKRPHEAPLAPDDYLPSVMTCVNYLKMPGYSSREKMRRRLETAMSEGSGSFYLS